MASLKYSKMWILLNEYKFEVDNEKYRDIICCICKSLLKNAQQSICGCEFCFDCIKNYLSTDSKYCPGRNAGCKELMVNIERNLQVDHAANKKVANVTVRCPIDNCEFRTELKAMDSHIDSHNDDVNSQGKFLREPLEKLKKEMNGLKEGLDQCRKDCLNKEMVIMKIREEMDRIRKASEAQAVEIGLLIDMARRDEKVSSGGSNGKAKMESNAVIKTSMEEDEIDWQLEIHSDEFDGDLNGQQEKRRDGQMTIQELHNGPIAGGDTDRAQAGPFRMCQEIRELIAIELQKQLGWGQERRQKWTTRNPSQLAIANQLLQGPGEPRESAPPTQQQTANPQHTSSTGSTQEEATVPSSSSGSGGTTEQSIRPVLKPGTRRKLNRELPQTTASPVTTDQEPPAKTPTVSKVVPAKTPTASKVVPTETPTASKVVPTKTPTASKVVPAPKPGKPLKAKIAAGSTKPIKTSSIFHGRNAKERIALSRKQRVFATTVPIMSRAIDPMRWMREIAPYEFVVNNVHQKLVRARQGFTIDGISMPFYSSVNGYKMCMRVDLGGAMPFGSHLGVFFCVIRGENDDHLPWPMSSEVTISLMDQVAFIPYTSRTFDFRSAPSQWKFVFDRPTISDGHRWFGTPQFVHFDFLFNNPSLLLNGSIMVRCSVAV